MKRMKQNLLMLAVFLFGGICLLAGCKLGITLDENFEITIVSDDVTTYTIDKGTMISEIPTPTKVGYSFVGWYYDNNFKEPVEATDVIENKMTLYAKWDIKTFSIKLLTGIGFQYEYTGKTTVNYGDNFDFEIAILDGYQAKKLKVYVNNEELGLNPDGSYTVHNITENTTIKVEGVESLTYYHVCYDSNTEGYEILSLSNTAVLDGGIFQFKLVLLEGYTSSSPIVYVNGKELKSKDGVYSIEKIKEDKEIVVSGIKKNQYTVSFAQNDFTIISSCSSIVEFGNTYSFKLDFDEQYDITNIVVTANDRVMEPDSNGYYYASVEEDIEIIVSGYQIKTFTIEVEESNDYEIVLNQETVNYGEDVEFMILMEEMYEGDSLLVKANDTIIESEYNGKYIVTNIKENINITVSGYVLKTFTVSYTASEAYEIILDKEILNYGDDLSFKVVLGESYVNQQFIVKVNNVEILDVNGFYVIEDVREDINITISGYTKKSFSVCVEESDAYKIEISCDEVSYGDSLNIEIKVNDDYLTEKASLVYNGNSYPLTITEINNITEDIELSIAGLVLKSFHIESVTHEGCTIVVSETEVNIHNDVTVTVSIHEGYHSDNLLLLVNNCPVNLENNSYVIEDITEDISIMVTGVEKIKYNITSDVPSGVVLSAIPNVVEYGETIAFNVAILDGYSDTNIVVYVNNLPITPVSDVYVIEVKSDITIKVDNVEKIFYLVTYELIEGVELSIMPTFAYYHDSISFTILVKDGYDITNMKVLCNNKELELVDGKYTVENIENNLIISIKDVEKIIYHVNYVPIDGIEISALPTSVYYYDSIKFTVNAKSGYDISNMKVLCNDIELSLINGEFVIENIEENITIVIKDVVLELYMVTVNAVDGITYELSNIYIEHGGSLQLTLSKMNGYKYDNLVVYVNNEIVLADQVNVYKILNITSDINITFAGVEKITYFVTLPTSDMYSIESSSSTTLHYNDIYQFKVVIKENIEINAVYVNGTKIESVNGEYYVTVCNNIDITVEVKQVAVTFTVDNYTFEVIGFNEIIDDSNYFYYFNVDSYSCTIELVDVSYLDEYDILVDGNYFYYDGMISLDGIMLDVITIEFIKK